MHSRWSGWLVAIAEGEERTESLFHTLVEGVAVAKSGSVDELALLGAPTGLHVAAIMDGNGRWAVRQGLERVDGHAAGEAAINAAVDAACEFGLGYLTLFAFSTENWSRPQPEVDFLMDFNRRLIVKHGADYHRRNIRVRYLGRKEPPIPDAVLEEMERIEALTALNTGLTLTFAFNHGGRAEIVDATRALLASGMDPSEIDEQSLSNALEFPDMPDPDLIIRTSGEYRVSNFMIWRAAYAEFVFMDVFWPDFRREHLEEALKIFNDRERRFGALPALEAQPASLDLGSAA
jgi:undecaprenyl diphosphate synthase